MRLPFPACLMLVNWKEWSLKDIALRAESVKGITLVKVFFPCIQIWYSSQADRSGNMYAMDCQVFGITPHNRL